MKRTLFFIGSLALLTPALVFAQDTTFVPLTNLPGISGVSGSPDLTSILNNIYRICIGAAAVIAVFQIMRAGVLFMFNKGSISENQEAKQLVQMSILGLILVLSPVIIFSIINPKILELNFGVDQLKTNFTGGVSGTGTAPTAPGTGTNDGAVVPPPSIIPATGATNTGCPVIADNQILTEPDLYQKQQCCANQTNDMVTCSAQAQTRQGNTVDYCGCAINEKTITFHDAYENTNGARNRIGSVPPEKATVDAFVGKCTQYGGRMDYKDVWEGFGDKFRVCPSTIVVPEGKNYDCVLVEATCKDDD
ncbi:MAG: hypothetical protein KBC16_00905 [Candidatus Pacebacteria bacterium]|nr:hypothetical protein [Candidatus Paceibacterota bacterium]